MSLLAPIQVTNAAWALPDLEKAALELKHLLCEGSALQGYTARKPHDPVTKEAVEAQLLDLQRAVANIAEQAGFNPVWLSESVHEGFNHIERRS